MKLKSFNDQLDIKKEKKSVTININTDVKIKKWELRISRAKAYLKYRISYLDRAPFSVIFIIFMVIIIGAIFTANGLRYSTWQKGVITNYPDLVKGIYDDKQKVYISPLDRVMIPINSRVNGEFFLFFILVLGQMLADVWYTFRDDKPQGFGGL